MLTRSASTTRARYAASDTDFVRPGGGWGIGLVGLLGLLVLGSCATPRTQHCGFDLLCPVGTVCNETHQRCVLPSQLEACQGLSTGDPCHFADVSSGTCDQGVCFAAACGNGRLDAEEVCDDGNRVPGDGCSADCQSDESCGNQRVDPGVGEQCDCGDDPANLPEGCRAVNGHAESHCSEKCRLRYCSNGVLDPGEACDDGNLKNGDGCAANCLSVETCGNGVVDFAVGETCDDGERVSGDGCSAWCRSERCGNGIRDLGESCDDGNQVSGDGCAGNCLSAEVCGNGIADLSVGETCDCGADATSIGSGCSGPNGSPESRCGESCHLAYCGNHVVDVGEVCDDGNLTAGDGCTPDCQSDESCGNGRLDVAAGETCDCGTDPTHLPPGCAAVNGDAASPCDAACQSRFCGNANQDPGEVCDDGNLVSGDGCRADCLSDETCGNGRVDLGAGERCDCGTDPAHLPDGCFGVNGALGGRCSQTCQPQYCGNGVVDPGEVCDDGNAASGDGCAGNCLSDETCGNGVVDLHMGEACDDGNQTAGDGCGATCQTEQCGNGVVDPGEVCDDGNEVSGDGCRGDCQSDETCGNGLVDLRAGETCDDGNQTAGDGCSADCQLEVCGNGVLDPGETCDDGNRVGGDGCSPDCLSDEVCGNGLVDTGAGETCDDGNAEAGDGCSSSCRLESCGNGTLDSGEVCDDGNNVGGDGCSADCLSDEVCGNGRVDVAAGETCDDWNTESGDGCRADCRLEQCGDGVVDPGEACDDGNHLPGDGCSADCRSDETCGNGVVDLSVGEACDDGNLVAGDGCSPECLLEGCGNGALEPGETCDDGNNAPGDGCSPDCASDETCGNRIVDVLVGESCDDGNQVDGDGCSSSCLLEYCGNGVVDPGEVCDDGNQDSGDGCRSDCLSDETCGNGVVDWGLGEQCDDGNQATGDGCGATCRLEVCGNGILDPGEVCDDGNVAFDDGCSADCLSNETCGNGIIDWAAGETCDDSNQNTGDGCGATCRLEVCGNGILDPGEACDDGNVVSGDHCSADCLSDETCGNGILDPGEECDDGNSDPCDGCGMTCQIGVSCPSGQVCCGGGCIPEDEYNCGACGRNCPPSVSCFRGTCIEAGVLVITEFMASPNAVSDTDGEYFELYNPTSFDINLNGWQIRDDNALDNLHVFSADVWVPAGGYAVLGKNANYSTNGGVVVDYQYNNFNMGSSDAIIVEVDDGTTVTQIDRVGYGGGMVTKGYASNLDPDFLDAASNDNAVNWCATPTSQLPDGDYGTPGVINEQCP